MKPTGQSMTRNEIRDSIKRQVDCRDYLTKAPEAGYICPKCGSGTGEHHTGALKYYQNTNTAYCHACGTKYDAIDLIMLSRGVSYSEALEIGAEKILLPCKAPESPTNDFKSARKEIPADKEGSPQGTNKEATAAPDNRQYYRECMKRITDPAAVAYLTGRGISIETARRYYLGYDPKADPAGKGYPSPRIIIPTTRAHYIGRSIDPENKYQKMNAKGATPGIFNERALDRPGLVFVCEGAFDALSVCEIGAEAVATNSANEAANFIKRLEDHPPAAHLILCEDKDAAGGRWAQTIREGLDRLGISFLSADISGQAKDANEALQADREAFTERVRQARRKGAELWMINELW